MALFDFLVKKQEEAARLTDSEHLKMDAETSSRIKKKLTTLEGTVSDMKAYEAKLTKEYQQSEQFKYGRESKPDYTGKGFAAFLEASGEYVQLKHSTKTVEHIVTEQKELERFKKQFLPEKLHEIDLELSKIKQQQLAKLREIENSFETEDNASEIDALYHQITDDYHKLTWRVNAIASYCSGYSYIISYERIERMTLATKRQKALQEASNAAARAKSENEAFSGN